MYGCDDISMDRVNPFPPASICRMSWHGDISIKRVNLHLSTSSSVMNVVTSARTELTLFFQPVPALKRVNLHSSTSSRVMDVMTAQTELTLFLQPVSA